MSGAIPVCLLGAFMAWTGAGLVYLILLVRFWGEWRL